MYKHLHFLTICRTVSIRLKKNRKKLTQKSTNYQDSEISELDTFCFLKIFEFLRNFKNLQKSRYKITTLPRLGNFRVSVENFFPVPYIDRPRNFAGD